MRGVSTRRKLTGWSELHKLHSGHIHHELDVHAVSDGPLHS